MKIIIISDFEEHHLVVTRNEILPLVAFKCGLVTKEYDLGNFEKDSLLCH